MIEHRSDIFVPRWASPPGDTMRDALAHRELTVEQFASSIGLGLRNAESLLDGDMPISIELAQRIESVLGGSASFWIARDGQYRDDLTTVAADRWAQELPLDQMVTLRWIDRPHSWQDGIAKALEFFGVPTLDAWRALYGPLLAAARFRFAAGRVDKPAVTAWLRKGEIEADALPTAQWNGESFAAVLHEIRRLTLVRDPAAFIPDLANRCASAGVAVVVVKAPRGCPASGAARFLSERKAVIVLTARYRTDDHLWFTFFHEAGHLLLHDRHATYVDEFEPHIGPATSTEEQEADAFAGDLLVPPELRDMFGAIPLAPRPIARFARLAHTSPGVIVGQLQHTGRLGFSTRLNGFKRRYRWNGPTLERA